jgi:hypothetical protein
LGTIFQPIDLLIGRRFLFLCILLQREQMIGMARMGLLSSLHRNGLRCVKQEDLHFDGK